jgi:hypothetical protein
MRRKSREFLYLINIKETGDIWMMTKLIAEKDESVCLKMNISIYNAYMKEILEDISKTLMKLSFV